MCWFLEVQYLSAVLNLKGFSGKLQNVTVWLVTIAGVSTSGMPSRMKKARALDPKEDNPLKEKVWKIATRIAGAIHPQAGCF